MGLPTVLVLLRADADHRPGGDVLHAREAAAAGRDHGFRVRVEAGLPTDLSGVDLVHLWNVTRPQDAWRQARGALERGVPYALTPLHHDLRRYHREGHRGLARPVAWLARSERAAERLRRAALRLGVPQQRSLLRGAPDWHQQRLDLVRRAARVLWTCERERTELCAALGLDPASVPGAVVPTAIPGGAAVDPTPARRLLGWDRPFAVCAGRVEDLKNPLAVLEALQPLGIPVAFIGAPNPRHLGYVERFAARVRRSRRAAWLGAQPREVVLSAMAGARVHVLASWAESVGRVTLEAAQSGCAVVSTNAGYASDLLRGAVELCDPADRVSIGDAVLRAWDRGPRPEAARRVEEALTWASVGGRLAREWRAALEGEGGWAA